MTDTAIILDEIDGRKAAAFVIAGQLDDFFLTSPDYLGLVPGTICRGVIDQFVKGQGGVFIKLPDGFKGFLRNAKGLRLGEKILIQVTSYPDEGKAIPVTDRIIFKGRGVIITPHAKGINVSRQIKSDEEKLRILDIINETVPEDLNSGMIVRSMAINLDDHTLLEEIKVLIHLSEKVLSDKGTEIELLVQGDNAHALALREWPVFKKSQVFMRGFEENGILDQLVELMDPRVVMGLGSIFIEPTRALVAVDVNTGGDFSPASGLKANLHLARVLPRQLRLRGLGGQITLDLAPMAKKDRKQFELAITKSFKTDPVESTLVGWTPLGHFEIQRKRERVPLRLSLKL